MVMRFTLPSKKGAAMKNETFCYKVELVTTNGIGNTTCNRETDEYRDCLNGVAFVITDNPRKIYDLFGAQQVRRVENMGPGYSA